MNTNETVRPVYSEGVKYEFNHAVNVSESMRLKSENPSPQNDTSVAGFTMKVSVSVSQSEVDQGGNMLMYIAYEPTDDSLVEEEEQNPDEVTEEVLMCYKVELEEKYKVLGITGAKEAMKQESLRYILTLISQLTPHVRNQPESSTRHLITRMSQTEIDELISSNGEVNSRGVEIPDQAHNVDLIGRDVYTITASNDNLIYPSAAMQARPGFASPKYVSLEKVTIDQDKTLVEDEKSLEFIIGEQDDEDSDRNLNEEDNITLKARIYQVSKVEGKLKLIKKQELKDDELSDLQNLLQKQDLVTANKIQVEKMLLYPDDEKNFGLRGVLQEIPRKLLSEQEIRTRVTSHYPSDFSSATHNIYHYKKDIVNMKILGHSVQGGVYAAAGYSYLFSPAKLGGFASTGAGVYVSSSLYTNDWYYFLTGGTTARFQGDKVLFEIGQLKDGKYTEFSYSKTLDNPWPGLTEKIIEIFNKETTLLEKLKELVREVKENTEGVSHLEIPVQFEEFQNQCTDLTTLVDQFLTDDQNLHLTQCLDLLTQGLQDVIQQIEVFIAESNAPQYLKDFAREVKDFASEIIPILEKVKEIVNDFEGSVKDIFKASSLPLEENITHLNEQQTLFQTCWPIWIVSVCVDAKSKQEASSQVSIDVMKLKGEAGPKYEATIEVDGYLSIYIARAGVRVKGNIASAYLGTSVKQKDNTNLAQAYKVGTDSCMESKIYLRSVQANLNIYYSYKTLSFSCKNWWCSFKVKWNDKTIANWPIIKEQTRQIPLIKTC